MTTDKISLRNTNQVMFNQDGVDIKINIKSDEAKYPVANVFKPSIKLAPLIKVKIQKAVKIKDTN